MKTVYRTGVIGSRFAGDVHVPALRAQGRFEVVAIASPTHAAEVAKRLRIPQSFETPDAMLATAQLDVVTIASPPFLHAEQLQAALAAGAHVLCEKPLALDVAQAHAMRDAAVRAERIVAIAHEFRFLSSVIVTEELIRNGHLGALREIEIGLFGSRLRDEVERPPSWWFERARGGGISGAWLSHLLDLAVRLAGRPPARVRGLERTANPERRAAGTTFRSDVADGAFAILDFDDGLIARVSVDGTRAVPSATVAVHGERRTVATVGPELTQTATFTIDGDETDELELRASPHLSLGAVHPSLPAFTDMLDEFSAAIDGTPVERLATIEDGLVTQRILAEIGYGANGA